MAVTAATSTRLAMNDNPPELYKHQKEALEASKDKEAFAFFMEAGTGKSAIIVHEVVDLVERDKINCAAILAPNLVHQNWAEQFEIHKPKNYNKFIVQVYKAQPNDKARLRQEEMTRQYIHSGRVLIFLMNIESLSSEYGINYLRRILKSRRATYLAADESHKLKTHSAKRTKAAIELGALAKYRRIATGTEAEEGIHNLYSQMKFLDWRITGYKFYTPFKNMFCISGGFENREIIGYQHQDFLARKIAPYIYQKRKAECLDLPDKLYVTHHIDLTKEQEELYDSLKEQLITEIEDGSIVDTTHVLARMVKLQEVLCGHLHYEDKVKTIPSNRAKFVAELVESSKKSIVFCRFVMDVKLVTDQLAVSGIKSVSITGETDNRLEEINSWRENPDCRALIMTTGTGGTGLTLNEAANTIFYSNSWSSTDRLQAEDRNHRIGQENHVTYHDIVVRGKLDSKILRALREKKNLADEFRNLTALKSMLKENEDEYDAVS